jgi:GAF domain-containing protein
LSRPLDVVAALTRVAHELQAPLPGARLQALAELACGATPGVDRVALLTRARDGRTSVVAATDEVVRALGEDPAATSAGPVHEALDPGQLVVVEHVRRSVSLPAYAAAGVRSFVAAPARVDDGAVGALLLCSDSVEKVSDEVVALAEMFAAHAGLALGHAQQVENLEAALETRKTIGMALGMVMQRHDLDEETAFAYLTRLSATSQTKLREVATTMVEAHAGRSSVARTGVPDAERPS